MSETDVSTLIAKPSPAEERFISAFKARGTDASRLRSFEAFAEKGLPHRRIENWRWSDLRAALKTSGVQGNSIKDVFADIAGPTFTFSAQGVKTPNAQPEGLNWSEELLDTSFVASEELPIAALTAALCENSRVLSIEISADQSLPIRLVIDAEASDMFSRIELNVREGVKATIVESHLNQGGFSSTVMEYNVEKNASVERVIYQSANETTVQVVTTNVRLCGEAEFTQSALATGAKLCRLETRVDHQGEGAKAVMNAAYLLDDGRHVDVTSHVRHSAGHCETAQVTKGAVKKGGKGAFQGKFYVARDAQKTDAAMAHNALLLEDGAEVNAKPELEIYADDVQCAHGNTAGSLDEDALFYMRQRGIPLVTAKAMLTQSFIAEGLATISDDTLREILEEEANQWLMTSL